MGALPVPGPVTHWRGAHAITPAVPLPTPAGSSCVWYFPTGAPGDRGDKGSAGTGLDGPDGDQGLQGRCLSRAAFLSGTFPNAL